MPESNNPFLPYPERVRHQNPNLPIAYAEDIMGAPRKVANLTELYGLTTKVAKLDVFVTKVYVVSESKEYQLIDAANIGNSSGWKDTTPVVPETQGFIPRVFEYDISSGTSYTDSELAGYNVLQVNRLSNLKITNTLPITQGDLLSNQVGFDGTTGTLTFGTSFSSTESVIVLAYKINSKLNQYIILTKIPSKTTSDTPFTLDGSASSGLPVTYTSSNTSVATVSGNTVTIIGEGTTTITASQAGNSTYNPASGSRILTVSDNTNNSFNYTLPFNLS